MPLSFCLTRNKLAPNSCRNEPLGERDYMVGYLRRKKTILKELGLKQGPLALQAAALTTKLLLGQCYETFYVREREKTKINS